MKHASFTTIRSARPISEIDFCAWLGAAEPGDRLEYHRGFLAVDRLPVLSKLPEQDRRMLSHIAGRALQLAEQDLVHLVQERLGPFHFACIAIARPKPRRGTVSLSTLLLEDAA